MTIYVPPHFEQTDADQITALIRDFPFATLVTQSDSGVAANHIPLQFDAETGSHGILRGHVARNNEVWQSADISREVLVIFQAPDSYITPNWYPSKQVNHEVVPTWNYSLVHLYGAISFHHDEKWLRGVIGKLTKSMEADQPTPWSMAQAPREFLKELLGNIVGVEIEVTRILAKWKVSQNRSHEDQAGVVSGLQESGKEWMAEAVQKNTT